MDAPLEEVPLEGPRGLAGRGGRPARFEDRGGADHVAEGGPRLRERDPAPVDRLRLGCERRLGLALPCREGSIAPREPGDSEHDRERRDNDEPRRGRAPAGPTHEAVPRPERPREDGLAAEPALELVGQLLGRAVAALGLALEAAEGDRLEVLIHVRDERARRDHILLEDGEDGRERRRPDEGRTPDEGLVEDRADRVDVDGRRERARPPRLLGGHVARRPDDGARLRELRVGAHLLREAEVGDERSAAGVDEDVRGLEVAVEHAAPVRVVHGSRDEREEGDARARVPGEPREPILEGSARDELHAEPGPPLVLAELVDGHDPRVVEARGGGGFEPEALELGCARERRGQHLERDLAPELRVASAVDDPHAAAGDLREHLVLAHAPGQRRARGPRGSWRRRRHGGGVGPFRRRRDLARRRGVRSVSGGRCLPPPEGDAHEVADPGTEGDAEGDCERRELDPAEDRQYHHQPHGATRPHDEGRRALEEDE